VCRSPDDDFSTFVRSLESVIKKVQARYKQLILCGDWNIRFMQVSVRLHDMQKLLSLHNLLNTVGSPTRVTKDTVSLIDIIITNKDSLMRWLVGQPLFKNKDTIGELVTVMDFGYLDHKS